MNKLGLNELDDLQNINTSLVNNSSLDISKSNENPATAKSKSKLNQPESKPLNKDKELNTIQDGTKSNNSPNYKTSISTINNSRDSHFDNKYLTSVNDLKDFNKFNKNALKEDSENQITDNYVADLHMINSLNKSNNKDFMNTSSPIVDVSKLNMEGYVTDKVDEESINHSDMNNFKNQMYVGMNDISHNFDNTTDSPPVDITDYDELKRTSKKRYIGLQDKSDKYYKMRKYVTQNYKDILKTLNKNNKLGIIEKMKLKHMVKKISKSETHSVTNKILRMLIKQLLRKLLAPIYTTVIVTILIIGLATPIKSDMGSFFDKGDLIKVSSIFGKRHAKEQEAIALAKWEDNEERLAEEEAEKAKTLNKDFLPTPISDQDKDKTNTAQMGHTNCSITNNIPSGTKASIAFLEATKYIGRPYHWGGCTPKDSFDCSGLWYWAFNQKTDIKLPRVADAQGKYVMKHGAWHNASDMKADKIPYGSLVFFKKGGAREIHHVGMYIGKNDKGQHLYLHSPCTGKKIQVAILEHRSDFYGGGLPYK